MNRFIGFEYLLTFLFILPLHKSGYSQGINYTGTYSITKDKYSPLLLIKQKKDTIFYEIWNFGGLTPGSRIGNTYGKVKLNDNTIIDISENPENNNLDTLVIQFSQVSAKISTKLGSNVFPGFETTNISPDGLYKKTNSTPPKFSFSENDFNESLTSTTVGKNPPPKEQDELNLFGGAIKLKAGDIILINNPSHKPSGNVWSYEYVYSDFWPNMPERSGKLTGRFNLTTIVKKLNIEGNRGYTLVTTTLNGKNYDIVINLKNAIISHEIELPNQNVISKMALFKSYLLSVDNISDNIVIGYINNFEPVQGELDEFKKRRVIQNTKLKLDSIKSQPAKKNGFIYFSNVQFSEYNFNNHSFKTDGVENNFRFDFDSDINGESRVIKVSCRNIYKELDIPMDEGKAEVITNRYFKNTDRTVYCIYTIDFTNVSTVIVKSGADRMYSVEKAIEQQGNIKSIAFFGDADYTNKIAEYNWPPDAEPKNAKAADRHASFPGGDDAFKTFMLNIHYPREAQEKVIHGTVFIKFIVDETGKIVNPSPVTHLGAGLEEEGLRLVKLMPNWLPAIKDGNPVKEEVNLPLKFSLQ
ncbi:energy transducer TonB [Chitinophaga sancti]|uniref:energy transducer TonB n=1 Tax=Chitinophaga sancti TaxID=1004 RepID=UPI002A7662B7|nr:energy transducer TonB [Chitinophaga sancti]WPQ65501.1 energy transducer TonB [Chitinophaga sancti]